MCFRFALPILLLISIRYLSIHAYMVNRVNLSGIVGVFKPIGWTSSDVVVKIRDILETGLSLKTLPRKKPRLKVGHGGTLDPMAEGVLVIGVGDGTKILGTYLSGSKGYVCEGKLGVAMDTLDSTGQPVGVKSFDHVTEERISQALSKFRGEIMQTPPMYSALKVNGQKLYDLARKGISVERKPRPVTVYELLLRKNSDEYGEAPSLPYFSMKVECSGGFYVRSLISDIAEECGSVAHMTKLLRYKCGPLEVQDCLSEKDWNFNAICQALDNSLPLIRNSLY